MKTDRGQEAPLPAPFVQVTAQVSPQAVLGAGTRVWNWVQIREGARLGEQCIISKGVYIDYGVQIGNRVKIQNHVSVYHGVTLEDGVFVGPHAASRERSASSSPTTRSSSLTRYSPGSSTTNSRRSMYTSFTPVSEFPAERHPGSPAAIQARTSPPAVANPFASLPQGARHLTAFGSAASQYCAASSPAGSLSKATRTRAHAANRDSHLTRRAPPVLPVATGVTKSPACCRTVSASSSPSRMTADRSQRSASAP